MFFFLSKILDIFLSPYTWGLLFIALAIPWRVRWMRRWKRRRAFGVAGLVLLYVFSTHAMERVLVSSLENAAVETFDPKKHYDVVILLGGVTDERITADRGRPAVNHGTERLLVTHELLRDRNADYVIITGAAVDPSLAPWGEARVLSQLLQGFGIAKERIILEEQALNTRENATYVAPILAQHRFQRALLVTSAYHIPRSVDCFRAVGVSFDTLPVDYREPKNEPTRLKDFLPRTASLDSSCATARELFGRLVYRVVGYGKS